MIPIVFVSTIIDDDPKLIFVSDGLTHQSMGTPASTNIGFRWLPYIDWWVPFTENGEMSRGDSSCRLYQPEVVTFLIRETACTTFKHISKHDSILSVLVLYSDLFAHFFWTDTSYNRLVAWWSNPIAFQYGCGMLWVSNTSAHHDVLYTLWSTNSLLWKIIFIG